MPQPTNPAIAKTSKSPQTHENQGVSTIFTDDELRELRAAQRLGQPRGLKTGGGNPPG
jgi:hypothetical protein